MPLAFCLALIAVVVWPAAAGATTKVGPCYSGIWQGTTHDDLAAPESAGGTTWSTPQGGGSFMLSISAAGEVVVKVGENFTGTEEEPNPLAALGGPEFLTRNVTFDRTAFLKGQVTRTGPPGLAAGEAVTGTLDAAADGLLTFTPSGTGGSNETLEDGNFQLGLEGTVDCPANRLKLTAGTFGTVELTDNLAAGRAFEDEVLIRNDLTKNGAGEPCGPGSGRFEIEYKGHTYIPDAVTCEEPDQEPDGITEVKCYRRLNSSAQFEAYAQQKVPITLYICPKTKRISRPLQALIEKSGGKIKIEYPDGSSEPASFKGNRIANDRR